MDCIEKIKMHVVMFLNNSYKTLTFLKCHEDILWVVVYCANISQTDATIMDFKILLVMKNSSNAQYPIQKSLKF